MMMRELITIALAGLALGAAHSALAEDASPAAAVTAPPVLVDPGAALPASPGKSAPSTTLRGFDQPKPALVLNAGGTDSLNGLAPGQDLVGDGAIGESYLSPADRDSYLATKEYQDKSQITVRGGSRSVGKQFAGTGKAAALNLAVQGVGNLAVQGVGALLNGGDDDK
jgi:hypothetical protein